MLATLSKSEAINRWLPVPYNIGAEPLPLKGTKAHKTKRTRNL